MICIWEGYIGRVWDSNKFCRIIDNTFAWAEKILRPNVSHYIDQWRFRKFCRIEELRFQVTHDPYLCSLVHKIEQSLNSLHFRGSSHLLDAAELIVSIRDAVESLSPGSKNAPDEMESDKSEELVPTCDPVLPVETPIEERKLSEVSLRDLTAHLQQLGIAPVQPPNRVQEAPSLAKPLGIFSIISPTIFVTSLTFSIVIEQKSVSVFQSIESLSKIVDDLNQHAIKLDKSYESLNESQVLQWASVINLINNLASSRNSITKNESFNIGKLTDSTPSGNILTDSHNENTAIVDSKQLTSISTEYSFMSTKASVTDKPDSGSSALPERYPDSEAFTHRISQVETSMGLPTGFETTESGSSKPNKPVKSTVEYSIPSANFLSDLRIKWNSHPIHPLMTERDMCRQ